MSNFPTKSSKLSKRRLDPNSDQIPAPFNYIGCEQRLTQICHFLHANAFSWPVKNATRSPLYLYLADCSDRITISFHSPPLYNTLNLNDLAYLQEGSFAIFLRLTYGANIKNDPSFKIWIFIRRERSKTLLQRTPSLAKKSGSWSTQNTLGNLQPAVGPVSRLVKR